MGCDIHVFVEIENVLVEMLRPFTLRKYAVFGWLAGVRNYSGVTPMFVNRGKPEATSIPEYEFDCYHSITFFTVDELLAIDYDQIIEDRRCEERLGPNIVSGAGTCEPGNGERMKLREFLGDDFMRDLNILKVMRYNFGKIRITIGFDS